MQNKSFFTTWRKNDIQEFCNTRLNTELIIVINRKPFRLVDEVENSRSSFKISGCRASLINCLWGDGKWAWLSVKINNGFER